MLLLVNTQYICIFRMHCVIILLLFKDIQCANLSAPANGEIVSCSSGRIGVGYEEDTCISHVTVVICQLVETLV